MAGCESRPFCACAEATSLDPLIGDLTVIRQAHYEPRHHPPHHPDHPRLGWRWLRVLWWWLQRHWRHWARWRVGDRAHRAAGDGAALTSLAKTAKRSSVDTNGLPPLLTKLLAPWQDAIEASEPGMGEHIRASVSHCFNALRRRVELTLPLERAFATARMKTDAVATALDSEGGVPSWVRNATREALADLIKAMRHARPTQSRRSWVSAGRPKDHRTQTGPLAAQEIRRLNRDRCTGKRPFFREYRSGA